MSFVSPEWWMSLRCGFGRWSYKRKSEQMIAARWNKNTRKEQLILFSFYPSICVFVVTISPASVTMVTREIHIYCKVIHEKICACECVWSCFFLVLMHYLLSTIVHNFQLLIKTEAHKHTSCNNKKRTISAVHLTISAENTQLPG